jgi:hypothetical protein
MNWSTGNSSATIPSSSNSLRWAAFLTPEQKLQPVISKVQETIRGAAQNSMDRFINL